MSTKLERLLNLTAALLETRKPMSAAHIRRRVPGYPEDVNSFRRTFERDKDDLREMGIPLEMARLEDTPGTPEGYWIPADEYYLRDPGLAPDELAALHLATRVMDAEATTEALWKLGGSPDAGGAGTARCGWRPCPWTSGSAPSSTPSPPAGWSASTTARPPARWSPTVSTTRRAAGTSRVWTAAGASCAPSASTGWVRGSTPVARSSPTPENRHPGVRLQPWESGDEATVNARLLVDADQAGWASHYLGEDRVEERGDDGSVIFAIPVTNREAFRSFVLTFLDHAEVLGPAELRREIVDWLQHLATEPA